jgi:hypothetical protein
MKYLQDSWVRDTGAMLGSNSVTVAECVEG